MAHPDPKVDLTIANSLWVHLSAHPVAPTFVSTDQNYYGAQIGDRAGAPADVNAWVDTQMQQALTALGMGIQGNLSGIYPGAFISDVEHKTVVEVNETGTVAAGATSVGISISAMQDPVNLTVNHPFFYAIRDNTTGELLFVGVLMNPGAG